MREIVATACTAKAKENPTTNVSAVRKAVPLMLTMSLQTLVTPVDTWRVDYCETA